jgi:quercetin dioxygenase-like cupin family protein
MIEKKGEYEKGLQLSVEGKAKEKIWKMIREKTAAWGIGIPDTEPLVLDFGLNDFWNTGETEFWIANEEEAGYCGKQLFLFKGQECPKHYHDEKLETFFIIKGALRMNYGNNSFIMSRGDILRAEPGVYHSFSAEEDTLVLEVSKPSIIGDNFFENPEIPFGKNYQYNSIEE